MTTLAVRDLHARYDALHVLRGVTLEVRGGDILAMLGRNGSGRSTLCKALAGLIDGRRGSVRLNGRELGALAPHHIARAGMAYVPEERLIFDHLSVEENLAMGVRKHGAAGAPRWDVQEFYQFYPRLHERRRVQAGLLSGGEQKLLALFRSLAGNPLAILVDEPTEGLSPQMVEVVASVLAEMKRRGLAILLMEQKMALSLRCADRLMVIGRGAIVFEGDAAQFLQAQDMRQAWLHTDD